MEEKVYDAAVVGGGIAGYTAALVLKNFKRDVLWLGTERFGDKLLRAPHVNNFPGFSGSGRELCALLEKQAGEKELSFVRKKADGVFAAGREFYLTSRQTTYRARTVVLATGVRTAGDIPGEERFLGRGVSYCAVCDGALYKGKTIACEVDSPEYAEEAEYLAGFAKKVFVFCRYPQPAFRAENLDLCAGDAIAELGGSARVSKIITRLGFEFGVDGVFFLRDATPLRALVGGLETEGGFVKTGRDMSTNLPGLFAAGDITGKPYQYAKAAGEGLVAAFSANEYLLRTAQEPQI